MFICGFVVVFVFHTDIAVTLNPTYPGAEIVFDETLRLNAYEKSSDSIIKFMRGFSSNIEIIENPSFLDSYIVKTDRRARLHTIQKAGGLSVKFTLDVRVSPNAKIGDAGRIMLAWYPSNLKRSSMLNLDSNFKIDLHSERSGIVAHWHKEMARVVIEIPVKVVSTDEAVGKMRKKAKEQRIGTAFIFGVFFVVFWGIVR